MRVIIASILSLGVLAACGDTYKVTEQIGVPGAQGLTGEAGSDGQDGADGVDGSDGTSCSSAPIEGGFTITCGSTVTRYLLPVAPDFYVVPQSFQNSVPYNINVYKENVDLPSSFTLAALVNNIGGGANGKITIQIEGISYCYQSQVGSKNFNYIGERADGLACQTQPFAHVNNGAPTIAYLKNAQIILEHRSDLASRWLLSRAIELVIEDNDVMQIN